MNELRVVEKFVSLQGESTHAGRVCAFIRLAGCNLRCVYCDTMYAHDGSSGSAEKIDSLTSWAVSSGVGLVEVTGGEPLFSPAAPMLCAALLAAGLEVLVETNGSLQISALPHGVKRILDCKLPDSGMAGHNLYANYDELTPDDEVKFVVSSRRDFDFGLEVIKKYDLPAKTDKLLWSPVWGKVAFDELARWVIDSRAPGRMQLQLHKLIWGNRPGV
ncbi:MAG: radical SAM protein [Victivallaceae bacterium]|nr:radical SAM protein [Victivallaceae bacterium]